MGNAAGAPDRRRGITNMRTGLVLVAVVTASCGTPSTTGRPAWSEASPTATASPTRTPTPSPPAYATLQPFRPTPTPSDAPAVDSLPDSVTVEQDGIRLTLALHSSPLIAGTGAVATVTLVNRGDGELRWSNDGCDTHAWVHAVTDARWPAADGELPEDLVPYRDWFLRSARVERPIWLDFRITHLASYRFYGCADLAVPRSLAPGRSVSQQFIWDGQATGRLGPPPSGPVTITATFERWNRPGPGRDGTPVVATLDSWVIGGRPGDMLSPAEIVDAALGDPRFAAIARARSVSRGNVILEYDLHLGLWAVGFLEVPSDGPASMLAAYVDPLTGEVIDVRQQRVEL